MSLFITIEGIEGSGKSTIQSKVAEHLRAKGYEVVTTREPGATRIGKELRSILLNPEHTEICKLCELMIYTADRAQHVQEIIKPALARGAAVLSDRYIHSTIAYQGYGRGIDLKLLNSLNDLATESLKPDLVLLLDLLPEIGLGRALKRAQTVTNGESGWTRFENEKLEFHRKLRQGYLELAKDPVCNFSVIDASQEVEQVINQALRAVDLLLG